MSTVTKNLGIATAYGYAKSQGYTGTEAQFAQLMADLITAKDDAEDARDDAQSSAEDSEAYAIGKRNGVNVTSGDVAYENNSKYYSDQASASAASINIKFKLLVDEIPDTTQSYTFSGGTVSAVTHKNSSNVTIRSDVFTYASNTITEVRTLNTGESLTIVTNLTTLETTVTYASA